MTAVKHTRHDSDLETLFPAPSLPPTVLCPQLYAGSSPEAVAALRHVLKDNHIKHHIFLNDAKFHKCVCILTRSPCSDASLNGVKPYHSSCTGALRYGREWGSDRTFIQARQHAPASSS